MEWLGSTAGTSSSGSSSCFPFSLTSLIRIENPFRIDRHFHFLSASSSVINWTQKSAQKSSMKLCPSFLLNLMKSLFLNRESLLFSQRSSMCKMKFCAHKIMTVTQCKSVCTKHTQKYLFGRSNLFGVDGNRLFILRLLNLQFVNDWTRCFRSVRFALFISSRCFGCGRLSEFSFFGFGSRGSAGSCLPILCIGWRLRWTRRLTFW